MCNMFLGVPYENSSAQNNLLCKHARAGKAARILVQAYWQNHNDMMFKVPFYFSKAMSDLAALATKLKKPENVKFAVKQLEDALNDE